MLTTMPTAPRATGRCHGVCHEKSDTLRTLSAKGEGRSNLYGRRFTDHRVLFHKL
ncbi:hypothetical protein HDF14_005539, partial [Edaphobacter lichenicola]|nr:hypothetical protein [Edaphobacter lichenicola]